VRVLESSPYLPGAESLGAVLNLVAGSSERTTSHVGWPHL
jgi:hypothetical protein